MTVMDRLRGRTPRHTHEGETVVERTDGRSSAVDRQHESYGGLNWGAAFFGWLVAVGIAVLLTALLGAAGAAVAIFEIDSPGEAAASADTISVAGGIALLVIALVAYFAGGYVAGRMSRFDGARQGFGVWLWAIIVTLVLALIGVIAGEEWNIFAGLDLPRIPVDEDTTTGGIILLAALLLATLLAAVAGGKAGEQYHRRVDRAGVEGSRERHITRDEPHAERTA